MDLKTTREAVVTNGVCTPKDQERIQEFISKFASKLKIDFGKDVTLSIRTKHNEEGANLLIKYKDVDIRDIEASQLNLFNGNGKAEISKEKEKAG